MKPFFIRLAVLPTTFVGFLALFCFLCADAAAQGTTNSSANLHANAAAAVSTISIPGPLRSFLRIAGISPEASAAEVLPLLSYNVFQLGYKGSNPTEFLRILQRYLAQARELQAVAGPAGVIRVTGCSDAATLLTTLGYKIHGDCGPKAWLETSNPERAFLTIDSGFPLTDFEEALQRGVPFVYPYVSSPVPLLFRNEDWIALRSSAQIASNTSLTSNSSLDTLLGDPTAARLYSALSRMDAGTRTYLEHTLGLTTLANLTPALDFYGSQLSIRSGRVLVPGGEAAEPTWRELVGADPGAPAKFVSRLLAKDDGWMAAYFDVLSRLHRDQQLHLTQPVRLVRDYEAFHGADPKNSALTGVARSASELLILDTRVNWDANGEPYLPGGLEIWKQILLTADKRETRQWGKRAAALDRSDQMLEAFTAFSRRETGKGILQFYLTLCELDRRRAAAHEPAQLSADTVILMAQNFGALRSWYPIFSEFPNLDDGSIAQFIHVARTLNAVHGDDLRANAVGAFQANLGLWQVLARQGEIPSADQNTSWQGVLAPFDRVASSAQLFDSTRTSFQKLLLASGVAPNGPPSAILDRLAGPMQEVSAPGTVEVQRTHREMVTKLRAVFEDQRLVSLDTLFALSDGLAEMERTGKRGDGDLLALAGELRGFELPRPIFSNQEKLTWAPGVYASHHAELQVQTDFARVLEGPATRAQVEIARGQLTPFLRDALVGLNYAYYEPPGAQILHVNSLFVRTHDFLGTSTVGSNCTWQVPTLMGAGISAGGGAYLMGSLADLPYALAEAEAQFIVPEHVQALVWEELAPSLLAEATLPRWWNIAPAELHAVALYQQSGEELLSASRTDPQVRAAVLEVLADQVSPQRLEKLQATLTADAHAGTPSSLMPSEVFYLAEEYRRRSPEQAAEAAKAGPSGRQLAALAVSAPEAVDAGRLSADFGVSHPTLANTNARELLHLQPFPFSAGSTNRLFGESLESTNLYWARLADESGYPPVLLNRLVPELTRQMVGKIFASNVEDWPAVLRAMQQTGDDLRQGKIAGFAQTTHGAASQVAAKVDGGQGRTW